MKKRYENRAGKYSLTDYRKYRLCLRESVIYGLLFLLAASAAGVLLFNRVEIGIGTGVLLQPVFRRKLRQFLQLRRKIKLEEEFCRYMQLTAASLAGGTALDNVFREIADTAAHGDSRYMEREFRGIDRLIRLNYDCPEAFQKFASRTGSRDIESIAAALRTVAESGGDLTELLKNGVNSLRMKQDTEREIRRSLSLPRMNHRILTFMPFGFILLFRSVSPAYITGLYEGAGLLVMGAVTILIGLAWLLGDRVGRLGFSL